MFEPWATLMSNECAPLVEAAQAIDDPADPAAVAKLRKRWNAELVRAALDLTVARRKGRGKFPHADRLACDPAGVEQATGFDVARHKARRFAALGAPAVDLGCGIGGDAMALAEVTEMRLIDRDRARAWMARHNVEQVTGRRCPTAVADAASVRLGDHACHLDPDRRRGDRRITRYEDVEPGPAVIEQLTAERSAAVKLSPAVDFEPLPEGEVEIINRAGTLVQAVLWTGRLARHERTATKIDPPLPSGQRAGVSGEPQAGLPETHTLSGAPQPVPIAEAQRYLLAVDPAVERVGLVGLLCEQLGLASIHPALGLLTAAEPVESPWLRPFELIEAMPWRRKRVQRRLAELDAGEVEVKTRGGAVDPDREQQALRGPGRRRLTVFVLRFERRVRALICRRLPLHPESE